VAIVKTLAALADRGDGDVMLVSHDGDFATYLAPLLAGDGRRAGVVAFREFTSSGLMELAAHGLEFHDLEHDVRAFTVALPRLRVIPIEDFDPWTLLG
jgi:uncharacterized protein